MRLLAFILLLSFQVDAQELVRYEDIYAKNNLFYRKDSNDVFTGRQQTFKKNGRLWQESIIENGKITGRVEYYNDKMPIVLYELFYNEFGAITKQIEYSKNHKQKWITYFDFDGVVKMKEEYIDELLLSRCEYMTYRK